MKQYFTNEVKTVLDKIQIVKNLSRKKFISSFILALIKSRKVQFNEIAVHLNDDVKSTSNETRIQDFFREVDLDYKSVALLLILFLPSKSKLTICIDRTEWDFGGCQVNILMFLVRCGDIHLPLYWELLDNKSGNSNYTDRIDILKSCIEILGKERIGLVLGDREFIGKYWFKYLKDNGLNFCMRIPKNHHITRIDGRKETVEDLLTGNNCSIYISDCMVDGVWANLFAKRLADGEILFLFGTSKSEYLGSLYKKRWTIESFFQNLKGRGFDLESTHLKCLIKLKKLIALVGIAYAICISTGIYNHKKVQKIPVKKHGYKKNSYFRNGLNCIREGLKKDWNKDIEIFKAFFCRFYRLIRPKIALFDPI
jgi:Transposase DDE domain